MYYFGLSHSDFTNLFVEKLAYNKVVNIDTFVQQGGNM